jgi:hypothetical protein
MLVDYELYDNKDKLGAKFFCQLHARVPDMFCNFYLLKNHKTAYNSATNNIFVQV